MIWLQWLELACAPLLAKFYNVFLIGFLFSVVMQEGFWFV